MIENHSTDNVCCDVSTTTVRRREKSKRNIDFQANKCDESDANNIALWLVVGIEWN